MELREELSIADLLPESLTEIIRDRVISGVTRAEFRFPNSDQEEDALTGALGQAIALDEPITFRDASSVYVVDVYYEKLRGRGRGAAEKILGADGIFQISIQDQIVGDKFYKGLPFQAKKKWNKSDRKLIHQAKNMEPHCETSIVIDYNSDRYTACNIRDVINHQGSKNKLREYNCIRPLATVLGEEFLNCDIGREGLYYDKSQEKFVADKLEPKLPNHIVGIDVLSSKIS